MFLKNYTFEISKKKKIDFLKILDHHLPLRKSRKVRITMSKKETAYSLQIMCLLKINNIEHFCTIFHPDTIDRVFNTLSKSLYSI